MSAAALHEVQNAQLALIGSARAGRRTLLDMLLSARGYEIAVCEDGPTVLEFLKENQPAIAIFDHDLPGMDGREICSRMRFITRLADTPIAIVTPSVDEMGGAAEFESFTDTTTADIVEAEPLGKKKLIERLENVIRDQRGAAYDGKVTIAMPTMAPPVPEVESPEASGGDDGIDVFVDDDVDIEVDVARAIYSNDGSHEERAALQTHAPTSEPVAQAAPQVDEAAAEREFPAEEAAPAADTRAEGARQADADEGVEAPARMTIPVEEAAATANVEALSESHDDFGEEMFLVDDGEDSASGQAEADDDIELFSDEVDPVEMASDETAPEWPETTADAAALVSDSAEAAAEVVEEVHRATTPAHEAPEPEEEFESELVGVAAERNQVARSARATDVVAANDTLVEVVTETEVADAVDKAELNMDSAPEGHGVSEQEMETEATTEAAPAAEASILPSQTEERPAVSHDSASVSRDWDTGEPAHELAAEDEGDDDLTATIEAAIEAVNLAAMEEAEYRAHSNDSMQGRSRDEAEPAIVEDRAVGAATDAEKLDEIDVKSTVEMVVESAEQLETQSTEADVRTEAETAEAAEPVESAAAVEATEVRVEVSSHQAVEAAASERGAPVEASANDYADGHEDYLVESPSAEADGQEEGEPAVLNEERSNMQALIAEQAERIDNLQERNVQLRQELEQLKADDAMRHEERSNLQALIKEQTEAITNLQQRNVQLRRELEQYKADEAKRESERSFLQSHTSEQAETIAKLQQLNALLRQELEQRKADEAPLRDFLQRLLDRDEENSAYQEAMRNEIISLTRENS